MEVGGVLDPTQENWVLVSPSRASADLLLRFRAGRFCLTGSPEPGWGLTADSDPTVDPLNNLPAALMRGLDCRRPRLAYAGRRPTGGLGGGCHKAPSFLPPRGATSLAFLPSGEGRLSEWGF